MTENQLADTLAPEPMGLPEDLVRLPRKYAEKKPRWPDTVEFLRQFQFAQPDQQSLLLDELLGAAVDDPAILDQILTNIDQLSELEHDPQVKTVESQLVEYVARGVEQRSSLARWTPERIEGLVKLGIDKDQPFKDVIEKLKSRLLSTPRSIQEAVDLYYNAAWAMVTTSGLAVREELFSILCFEKEWLKPGNPATVYFKLGGVAAEDAIFSKYQAVRNSLDYIGLLQESPTDPNQIYQQPKRLQQADAAFVEAISSLSSEEREEYGQVLEEQSKINPNRVKRYQGTNGSRYQAPIMVTTLTELRQPGEEVVDDSLIKVVRDQIGPQIFKSLWESILKEKMNQGFVPVTDHGISLADGLRLEIIAQDIESKEQKDRLIREILESGSNGQVANNPRHPIISLPEITEIVKGHIGYYGAYDADGTVEVAIYKTLPEEQAGKLSSIIEYHRPLISIEQIPSIIETILTIKQHLRIRSNRSVRDNGYKVLIADPGLRVYGYESITFNQTSKDIINVGIRINGQEYRFSLDKDFRIKFGQDVNKFFSPQDQAWLLLLTLSHLKRVMCLEEDREAVNAELLGGEKQYPLYTRQVVNKIEHLRKLAVGEDYSTTAYDNCLDSFLQETDLWVVNEQRKTIGWGGTKEFGRWTYVKPTQYSATGQPIKLAFKNATEDMRKVIDLGAVSQAELDRLEREILGELEATT